MIRVPVTPEVQDIAARVVWFEAPAKALSDPVRFLAYAMRYGAPADMRRLRALLGDETLAWALEHAPPGILDPRSWWYWHAVMGVHPPPPMPNRRLPG